MSREKPKSLFFLGLPELKKLVCVTLSLQDEDDQEPRSKQMKACRALVLLYSDLLACPSLDSFTGIRAVMAIQFFQRGFLQAFAQRNNLQLGCPQAVLPADLQCCLSYSLITRLSPRWNKAGLYLIAGTDFLTERGRFNAISMEMSTSEGRLCLSLETNRVYLPPITLEDFELPPIVLRRFYSDSDSVINPSSTGRAIWCHVLPSMKKGQIVSISRQLPRDGPFKSYVDLQNHWNRLVLNSEQINLVSSIFIRPILTQLPAPPPLPQPPSTSSDSQPSSRTPLLLQKNSENLLRSSQTDLFSSSFSTSSPFQPASSLSVPPPSQIPPIPPPMVPIFRNKNPSHHINVARLRVLNQEQQGRRRQGERGRITLPVFGRESPSSSSAASRPLPPPIIPRFSRPNPSRSTSGGPQPRITYVSSLSPVSKVKPDIIAPPKLEIRPKTKPTRKVDPGGNTETGSSLPLAADASNEDPFISSKKKEHKSRKPRAVVQDVDIERLAQNRQLWKVNSASLLLFLRRRGVPVGAKERKEELMMKVMSCLVEA
uniref:Si:ch211-152c8.2 n=1 Tax=Nothobranchius furzeri TaxID=105023 RepID=A0A8C6LPU2_NOTFU